MALPSTNDFTGRIWRVVTTGIAPFGNVKIKGGLWSGGSAGTTLTFTDIAGRTYDFVFPSGGNSISIPEMGWLSGPINFTAMPGGELQLYIATK